MGINLLILFIIVHFCIRDLDLKMFYGPKNINQKILLKFLEIKNKYHLYLNGYRNGKYIYNNEIKIKMKGIYMYIYSHFFL